MKKNRILVIDDNLNATRIVKLALERTGSYEVRELNDPAQGLEAAREFRPDLILLDVCMPDIEGSEVAEKITSDPDFAATPIVFLTSIVTPREAGKTGQHHRRTSRVHRQTGANANHRRLRSKTSGTGPPALAVSRVCVPLLTASATIMNLPVLIPPTVLVLTLTGVLAVAFRGLARRAAAAVAKQKCTAELLEESELRFRILARATNEAVWDWNLQTNAQWWNRNVQTLFGYPEEEIEFDREWWTQHVHLEDRERVCSGLFARVNGNKDFWSAEYRFRRADGSYANIFDRGYILRDRQGRGVRMIGSMMDITERQREMEMARSRDAALESARLKSQFLANMSHEIRTPMNSIIGMTDILIHTELTSEQREFVEIVRVSGESLLTIINDILDFSKIEAGKLHFEMLDFEPRSTVDEVIMLLGEQVHAKKLNCPRSSARMCPVSFVEMRAACGRCSPIWSATPSNSRRMAGSPSASRRKRRVKRRWPCGSRLPTPVSVFRMRPAHVCSNPSRKWTPRLRENTAAPGLGWRSASNSSTSWAVKLVVTAFLIKDRPFGSPFSLRKQASPQRPWTPLSDRLSPQRHR